MFNYFPSKAIEISYYLLEMDGKQRMDKLGITQYLFGSKYAATKWYEEKKEILLLEDTPVREKALEKLEYLYKQMY